MTTIYFIDSENVGDSWIELLSDTDSRFIVFYTGHSPRIAYPQAIQLMNAVKKPEFVKCYEGNNGLDFQLVSYLGYELRADSSNEMIIVSNDTGFDAAVFFWRDREMNVKRITSPNASSLQPTEQTKPVSDDGYVTDSPSVEETEKIGGVDKSEIYTIVNCIGADAPSYIHLAFVHFYGNPKGENIYKIMKKDKFVVPPVKWNKQDRMKEMIELIVRYTRPANVSIPNSLTGFIMNNIVDDKKAMRNKLVKSYDNAGTYFHKMFKPFYKTLVKIKKK